MDANGYGRANTTSGPRVPPPALPTLPAIPPLVSSPALRMVAERRERAFSPQWMGGAFGMTPPHTPRQRTTTRRDREERQRSRAADRGREVEYYHAQGVEF